MNPALGVKVMRDPENLVCSFCYRFSDSAINKVAQVVCDQEKPFENLMRFVSIYSWESEDLWDPTEAFLLSSALPLPPSSHHPYLHSHNPRQIGCLRPRRERVRKGAVRAKFTVRAIGICDLNETCFSELCVLKGRNKAQSSQPRVADLTRSIYGLWWR
jgi:hypothetical protein